MNGFLILDKDKDISSFQAVDRLRRFFGVKKAGHTGTLDPMATGVLVAALGHCTSFISLLPAAEKEYEARFITGIAYDTDDVTGTPVLESAPCTCVETVRTAAAAFVGDIMQVPPAYSAIKQNGVKMYELARRGDTPDIPARAVTIRSIDLRPGRIPGEYVMTVICSPGTYVRSLIRDIGASLGCGAAMSELRRVRSDGFCLSDAVTLDELKGSADPENYVIPADKALALPEISLTTAQSVRFKNGGEIDIDRLDSPPPPGYCFARSKDGELLGLGFFAERDTAVRVKRVIV